MAARRNIDTAIRNEHPVSIDADDEVRNRTATPM